MSDEDPIYYSVHNFFENCIKDFLKIAAMKNLSPIYNPNWETDGDLLNCLNYLKEYVSSQGIKNIENLQVFQEPGVTPALFFTAPNPDVVSNYNILFISNIDKIPFGDGWNRFQPDHPGVSDGYLYGRGTANGLYAIFVILALIKACEENNKSRPNIAVLIESSYETNSKDLMANLNKASTYLQDVKQIICLDTWSPTKENYHYMKSCRGSISFDIRITTGKGNVHAGTFGGLIPDPIMILNNLLSNKIETIEKSEDTLATNIKIPLLEYNITEEQKQECKELIDVCTFKIVNMFPYSGISNLIGSKNQVENDDYLTAYMNGVFRPSFSIVGFEEMPDTANAGGIIRPDVCAKLIFRTPPTLDAKEGLKKLKELLTTDPPYGAKIEISNEEVFPGVDLETSNNLITQEMIDSFNKYCTQMKRDDPTIAVRMGRTFPGLYYLTQEFKDVPIFVTGCGNTFSDKVRDGDECINLIRLINYTSCLTYYVCDFNNYK